MIRPIITLDKQDDVREQSGTVRIIANTSEIS